MRFNVQHATLRQAKADALVFMVHEDKALFHEELADLRKLFGKRLENIITLEQFRGKESELLSVFTEKRVAAPRMYLVGLGTSEKSSLEQYRRAAALAAGHAAKAHLRSIAYTLPSSSSLFSVADLSRSLVEGASLSLYKFDKYITEKKDHPPKITEIGVVLHDDRAVKEAKGALNEFRIIFEATSLARDLSNAPGNEIYPETLADAAQHSAEKYGYQATIWTKNEIEEAQFGGLLAVNAGSHREPRFIVLEHNMDKPELPMIVLVGKGITFDAGGISIKPSSGMAEMKMDMAGAAAVIGTLEAAARLKLPIHLIGLIPSTENLLGGAAMRPGDIIRHYGGKTSEVDNTDAEGRLVLADALAYASTLKPQVVIDLATLTGACVVALGHHATGMMGNNDEVMNQLKEAGEKTYERVWPLPLFDEYEKQIKSDVADVKNVGGRWAGAITAGLFLKKFIGDYKWVHLDIAGTAILEEALPYAPKGGSGVGVRLLTEFLKNWKAA